VTATRTTEEQSEPQGGSVAARAPLPGSPAALLQLQRQIGNRAFGRWLARREVSSASAITGPQDWTTADREAESFPKRFSGTMNPPATRWTQACLRNLNAADNSQYRRVVERRDFYWWFYHYIASRGYTTRWPLAAAIVANGAHQIADMDEHHAWANDALTLASVQLQGMMREGNQVIFDNVLPKLKRLSDGGPITGRAALDWDMQTLAEEQTLVQPMYARMSAQTRSQIDYIARQRRFAWLGATVHLPWNDSDKHVPAGTYSNAGDVPAFNGADLQSINDRWTYGMNLGNQFTPGGSGFDATRDAMPGVSADYTSGAELRRVDVRAALHELDAWLNPNRLSRVGSGSDIDAIIRTLTDPEKREVLADSSPDGWAYSYAFAQFSFITEAQVRAALPTDPASAAAVNAFVARWQAESQRVQMMYPTPMYVF
jgi:hypothetical protein